MNVKLILSFFCLIFVTCTKHLDNKYDPATTGYWITTYLSGYVIPRALQPLPTSFSYTPSDMVFTTAQANVLSPLNKANIGGTLTSASSSPAFPSGISFKSNWEITPNNPSTTQAATKYTITGCNISGCLNTDVTIQIVNAIGNSVWGQDGSFTSITSRSTNSTFNTPKGIALDSSGGLYVADSGNNRVLYFPVNSQTATRVYGQLGSLTANTVNNGGISANSLQSPTSVAVDSNNGLYISDTLNHRILYYPSGSTTATAVYGQGGSFTASGVNNGGRSANSLNNPTFIALDSSNNLYVADTFNSRVLFYLSGSTTATRVYGQNGSFSSGSANLNTNNTLVNLSLPTSVFVSSLGTVYIADQQASGATSSRILAYDSTQTTAKASLPVAITSTPIGIYVDSKEGIYIPNSSAGTSTNVINYFSSMQSTSAKYSFGGTTDSTVTATSISLPNAIILDKTGNVYISDSSYNRVIKYNQ